MTGIDRERLVQLFRDESSERLDRMVEILLEAERGGTTRDDIAALFREAHSVKGSAGMFGVEDAYEIADAIEDTLADARRVGQLDPSLVGPLLSASDALRRAVHGGEDMADEAVHQLEAARSAPPAPVAAPATEEPGPPESPGPAGRQPDQPSSVPDVAERRSVRIQVDKVDRLLDAVGESMLNHRRLERSVRTSDGADDEERTAESLERGGILLEDLQDAAIGLRMMPLSSITGPFSRAVRDLAVAEGKQAELRLTGAETQLDRVVLDGLSEVLGHLLRNAVAHGLETPAERERAGKPSTGRIDLHAEQSGARVVVEVRDDGRGVAPELLGRVDGERTLAAVLAEAGVSTAEEVTAASGRGVGLDAVSSQIRALGGDVDIASTAGQGTAVTLLLPVSVAMPHVLLVERAGTVFALPLTGVLEVLRVDRRLSLGGRRSVDVRGESVPLVDLVAALGGAGPPLAERHPAVLVRAGGRRLALAADVVLGEQDVLVKPLGRLLASLSSRYLGGAILDDGRVAPVVDLARVVPDAHERPGRPVEAPAPDPAAAAERTVLVVDDQFTVRELQRSILEAAGYRVRMAGDGREAWETLTTSDDIDLVVTDIEMPRMDGLELTAAIRRLPERASLPVVIVTSRGGDEDHRRGLEVGADAYIVKERFDQRALLDTVRRLVES